ncbi:inositol monophosphatase family protein [Bacillus sp. DTU_2020_1000418_1_SI_GHA_SEK_038]|uniref:inositol monophosphatase family protein n=1 Tax=Bacillus sp. DTU_2020_1000418_1_SI_GHA_SEK_038 TaxID=3077585 RepID=UPI0028E9381E|nr:inositol monophosphatase family protein [Bacillus sp. DTU_2020_1000418_1_SI_GHA_SEK_038]WNS77025.1 inositol monophosphatase family protein [Bacillus sp. DTU_2020_1000418_1_SI_GHA_SEK_038]
MNWTEIKNCAMEWTKEAGENIKASFSKNLVIQTKTNANDLVTDIDKSTEQFFIKKIKEGFPTHKILGEEGLGDKINNLDGVVWIIDPIDGTMNFIHQQRNFAISIGIYEDGIGKIGLIYDVVHDELYHAIKGSGVFLNDLALPPLEPVSISEAIIGINATWVTENKRVDPALLSPIVKEARGTRSYGSAALEMAYIASGRIDAYITLRLAPWDIAAGIILVEELGGIATTLKGEALSLLENNTVFISKPGLHQEIMSKYLNNGNW